MAALPGPPLPPSSIALDEMDLHPIEEGGGHFLADMSEERQEEVAAEVLHQDIGPVPSGRVGEGATGYPAGGLPGVGALEAGCLVARRGGAARSPAALLT